MSCVLVRIIIPNAVMSPTINGIPVAYVESVTYLGTVIKAGRVWRTDSSARRRQCFKAFNSIYCRSPYLSEPTMQQLTDAFCKPVLLYNSVAVNLSKFECNRIDNAWKTIMYKIYGVSGEWRCIEICICVY